MAHDVRADLDEVREQLREIVPEIKYAVAHGRMAPSELEAAMSAFDERAYDLLLSTNISCAAESAAPRSAPMLF